VDWQIAFFILLLSCTAFLFREGVIEERKVTRSEQVYKSSSIIDTCALQRHFLKFYLSHSCCCAHFYSSFHCCCCCCCCQRRRLQQSTATPKVSTTKKTEKQQQGWAKRARKLCQWLRLLCAEPTLQGGVKQGWSAGRRRSATTQGATAVVQQLL